MDTTALKLELEKELAPQQGEVVIWPESHEQIPDDAGVFRVAFLGPDFAGLPEPELRFRLGEIHRQHGPTRRLYRNALAYVVPACSPHDTSDLAGFYDRIALPTVGAGYQNELEFQIVPLASATENLWPRILATLEPHLHHRSFDPAELRRVMGLGMVDCAGVERLYFPIHHLARWFFSFPALPKLQNRKALNTAILQGLAEGQFGLLETERLIELDSRDPNLAAKIQWNSTDGLTAEGFSNAPGLYLADPSLRSLTP